MEHDICKLLNKEDPVLEHIMAELEYAEEAKYTENLSPCEYIRLQSRYETLKEIRDIYCENLKKD